MTKKVEVDGVEIDLGVLEPAKSRPSLTFIEVKNIDNRVTMFEVFNGEKRLDLLPLDRFYALTERMHYCARVVNESMFHETRATDSLVYQCFRFLLALSSNSTSFTSVESVFTPTLLASMGDGTQSCGFYAVNGSSATHYTFSGILRDKMNGDHPPIPSFVGPVAWTVERAAKYPTVKRLIAPLPEPVEKPTD